MNRRKLLGVLAILPLVHVPAMADTLDDVLQRKLLRVAVLQDYAPFGSIGPDMAPRGYDVDVARLVARKLGVPVEITPVSGANRIPYLETRKVDLIIGCLGRNAEREKAIDFGPVYAVTYNGVWGPANTKVGQPADLVGKSIGVSRGSTEDLDLSKIAPSGANIKRFDDSASTIAAYRAGQTDLVVTSNTMVAVLKSRDPHLSIQPKIRFADEKVWVGLNKGEPRLKARLDAIFGELRRDGSLEAISEKWLGTPLPAGL